MIPAAAVHAPKGFFATGGGYEDPCPARAVRRRAGSHRPWRLVARCPAGSTILNPPWMVAVTLLAAAAASALVLQRRRYGTDGPGPRARRACRGKPATSPVARRQTPSPP